MNTKVFKKFIAAFLAILLVAGVITPLAEPIAAATGTDITDDFIDDNFKAAVRRVLGLDADGNIYTDAVEAITELDVSSSDIDNLAGIEHFIYLQELDVSDNSLTSLDVSTSPELWKLNVSDNDLTSLDVSSSPALKILSAADNNIRTPTLGTLTYLETLDLSGNRIISLNVSELPALKALNLSNNAVNSLTFGTHPYLETLNLSRNRLTTLNVSTFTALKNLDVSRNILTTINFGTHPDLETLDLSINGLTALNVSTFAALLSLDVSRNSLTAITLGNHLYMRDLNVSSNQLTTLDVSHLPALVSLRAWRNSLTTLDVSNLTDLSYLDITRNNFRTIAMIVGLANTKISPITEGESWSVNGVEHGFFFHPQNTAVTWPFDDVLPRDWFYDYVFWASNNDITTGFRGTNEFRPRNPVTRGQFATFLYRIEGEPAVSGGHSFSDVQAGRYFTIPVTWASSVGVVTGFAGTAEFRPDTNISREQIATMLHRYIGGPAPEDALDDFIDSASVSSWALNAMRWAVDNDIVQGNRGRLLPQDNATRAEAVAMLYRAFN